MGKRSSLAGHNRKKGVRLYGYDRSVYKVVILASVLIVFSMLLTGTLGYYFTENGVVDKLKKQDLGTIARSIAGQLDGRIERAKETAVILADDPLIREWVEGGEKDTGLQDYAVQKLRYLHQGFDYSNSFLVSGTTNHYWSEAGTVIDTVSTSDPDDSWFFTTMKSGVKVTVDIDYNEVRQDTFAFINAIMGDPARPAAVAGIGMSLQELSREFQTYKYGDGSNVWLVNREGEVLLSDQLEHNGRNLGDQVPADVWKLVQESFGGEARVAEIKSREGELTDLISYPLRSTDLRLLVLIKRSETVSFLDTIKQNTIIAIVISIISVVVMFYFISNRLANPYKRALQLNQELEQAVAGRTRELAVRNEEIMDSIGYAKRIQETMLPSPEQMSRLLAGIEVLWKPKDVVGGDFYWVRPYKEGCLVGVGDCTGHGVPGAFMTLLAVSKLDRIIERDGELTPGGILEELNRMLKATLGQEERNGNTDDGLDLGLCYVSKEKLVYAGAGCPLFVHRNGEISTLDGDKKSIGYRRTSSDFCYRNQELEMTEGDVCYMATDGLFDQNGGAKDYSFGKSRFLEWLSCHGQASLAEQGALLRQELETFQGESAQRDDITWLAFRP
jgi:serine phosphatase RsbU (regulator of sigma subunit)